MMEMGASMDQMGWLRIVSALASVIFPMPHKIQNDADSQSTFQVWVSDVSSGIFSVFLTVFFLEQVSQNLVDESLGLT